MTVSTNIYRSADPQSGASPDDAAALLCGWQPVAKAKDHHRHINW